MGNLPQGTGGTRDHTSLLNRNVVGQHSSESVGVLSSYAINPNDIGKNWQDLGDITGANRILRGACYLGSGIAVVGDDNGDIWRSSDQGGFIGPWTKSTKVLGTGDAIFSIIYLGNGRVIAGDIIGRIFVSLDFGVTWLYSGNSASGSIFSSAFIGTTTTLSGVSLVGDVNGHIFRQTFYNAINVDEGVISTGFIDSITYLDNGIVIFTDNQGHIFRSTTYGTTAASWTDLGDFSTSSMLGSACLSNGVALTSDGLGHIFRSTDFGLNWTDLGSKSNGGSAIQALSYLGNGIVIFGDFNGHIFKSSDYGLSWTDIGVGGAAISGTVIRTIANCNGIIIVGDNNGHIFINDVSNKIDEARATVHNDLLNRSLAGVSAHNSELVGTFSPYSMNHNDIGGTFGATNGNWLVTTSYISGIVCTAYIGSGIVIVGASDGHLLRSTDHGKNFDDLTTLSLFPINSIEYLGNGVVLAADNDVGGHIFHSGFGGTVANYGISWTDSGAQSAFTITKIRYLGHGVVIFTDGNGFVTRSADFGITWPLSIAVAAVQLNTAEYLDNGIVLVGDNSGKIFRQTSFASGAFTQVTALGTGIRCIQYLGNGIVVAGDNNGHILRSTDFGLTWTDLGDITGSNFIVITMAYLGNGVVIAGVVQGVAGRIFKSLDYGLFWTNLTPGGSVSGTFFNTQTAKYIGNGVTIIADNAGNILRHDVSYKTDEFIQDINKRIRTISTGETLETDDNTILADATGGPFTIFLPSVSSIRNGQVYNIKKIDASANIVAIDAAGAQTIDGALTYPLTVQYQSVTVISMQVIGAGWYII